MTKQQTQLITIEAGSEDRHSKGLLSAGKTLVNRDRREMPVEGFEPSSPYGQLFLRQSRIPFRHAGLYIQGRSYHYLSH